MPVPEDKLFSNLKQTPLSREITQSFNLISEDLKAVTECIRKQLVTSGSLVNERLEHVAAATGKMVRPALVLLSGKCCDKTTDAHIEIAAIVEMIHIATLLHDDVIDRAESRRNVETANALWGNESAVLLGDFLLSKAFALSAAQPDKTVSKVLADTAIQICTGELRQNAQRNNWNLTEEQYFEIIEAKTASLFAASCKLGAIAADADPQTADAFSNFGKSLGTAFQIADDLIDITGAETQEGKTLGRDLAEAKPTLPVIHMLNNLPRPEAEKLADNLSKGSKPENYEQLLTQTSSLQYSRKTAADHCKKALHQIAPLKDTKPKQLLTELVNLVNSRCK